MQKFIEKHTTVTTERTVLRLLGVDGVDDLDAPLPNVLVDAISRYSAQAAAGIMMDIRTGEVLGLAFQVVDDVLDVVADAATLGKTPGKDAANDKPTYVALLGLPAAQALAQDLLVQACAALDQSGLPQDDVQALHALAHQVVGRSH